MLRGKTYQEVCRNFKWQIPQYYNIGVDVCDKWANERHRLALIYIDRRRNEKKVTFRQLRILSNQLANALKANGIKRKDRVGILLSQRPETLISHIAVYKLAAIAVQLLTLFGPEAIEFRLQDCMAKAVVTDNENLGGSYDALFRTLQHGYPLLAYKPRKFDPVEAFYMIAKHRVRNLMAVPTVLRMMMHAVKHPCEKFDLNLRSITAGGETLGEELGEWSRQHLGVDINEQYGQTECDLVVGFCSEIMDIVPGAIGKAVPGHVIRKNAAALKTDHEEVYMTKKAVLYDKKQNVGIITLNRPERLNAINKDLLHGLIENLEIAAQDQEIVSVILTGAGRAFCAGEDLKETSAGKNLDDWIAETDGLQEVQRVILALGKPLIAAVRGYALGGGCEFAMSCDIRIIAEDAKFGFPETEVGLTITTAGTKLLAQIVGLGKAKEMVFTGDMIDANEALRLGLANKVVSHKDLLDAALALAQRIGENSPLALKLSRIAIDQGLHSSFEQTLELEASHLLICAGAHNQEMFVNKKLKKMRSIKC